MNFRLIGFGIAYLLIIITFPAGWPLTKLIRPPPLHYGGQAGSVFNLPAGLRSAHGRQALGPISASLGRGRGRVNRGYALHKFHPTCNGGPRVSHWTFRTSCPGITSLYIFFDSLRDSKNHSPGVNPPSTGRLMPLIYEALSEARKVTAQPASLGSARRRAGIVANACFV